MLQNIKFVVIISLIFGSSTLLMASKRIVVDLTHQIAIAYQDGEVKFYGRVSTGKPGRRTPTGSFYVREKELDHVSNLWPQPNGGAEMPYMLRITRDGVAMHLGPTPDYPASHGCIRMRDGFAQRMYAWAEKWTRVDIIGSPPVHSPAVALPSYARSASMLRKSLGGGMMHASTMLSSNPKVLKKPSGATSKQNREERKPVHLSAVNALSTNPKHHILQTSQKKTTSDNSKRNRTQKERHPDPLRAVSGQQ